ncbi:MAG: helix-turn-helix domain-containing protein [Deltaproteobacteria bacterium]|nr:helix-turn-helix domain-containing protein [Deltaproteobacteria bacterium]
MNIVKRKEKLISELKNKEHRDAFLAELITTGIPFQIKILREQRDWKQKELGDRANMAQETISRLEDPNYGKLNLTTLKRLASAFDIGLVVRFVPFSELVNWETNLSLESLEVLSFDEESFFQDIETDQSISTAKASDILDQERPITDSVGAVMPQEVPVAYNYRGDMVSVASDRVQALIP